MDSLPGLGPLSEPAQAVLSVALGAEVQPLRACLSALEHTPPEPVIHAVPSCVPPPSSRRISPDYGEGPKVLSRML
jgi:hypothetical protein